MFCSVLACSSSVHVSHRVVGVFSWLSVVAAAEELKLTRANANGADSGHEGASTE